MSWNCFRSTDQCTNFVKDQSLYSYSQPSAIATAIHAAGIATLYRDIMLARITRKFPRANLTNYHVHLLKLFVENDVEQFSPQELPRLPPLILKDNQYTAEKILDHKDSGRGRRKRREYFMHWGYGQEGF